MDDNDGGGMAGGGIGITPTSKHIRSHTHPPTDQSGVDHLSIPINTFSLLYHSHHINASLFILLTLSLPLPLTSPLTLTLTTLTSLP